jgi:integrase
MARLMKQKFRYHGELRETEKWYAELKNLEGKLRRIPLSTDKRRSQRACDALVDAIETIRAGAIVDPQRLPALVHDKFLKMLAEIDHPLARSRATGRPIQEHVNDYGTHLAARGVTEHHRKQTIVRLETILKACGFNTLRDLATEPVEEALERWKIKAPGGRKKGGIGPRTRNTYLSSLQAFIAWCMRTRPRRLDTNPLEHIHKANEEEDIRKQRRALTEDEMIRLLEFAKRRPIHAAKVIARGKRKGQHVAELGDRYRAMLERKGAERALMYKTLVLTGLRAGELRRLRWCDVMIDSPAGRDRRGKPLFKIKLPATTTKAKRIQTLTLRADLAAELRTWRDESGPKSTTDLVFRVPTDLLRRLKKDLTAAGIPYCDEEGRTVDVHALRHTKATWMAMAGVPIRKAQEEMRHSTIMLTMKVYTDVRLLDDGEAVGALPSLSPTIGQADVSGTR